MYSSLNSIILTFGWIISIECFSINTIINNQIRHQYLVLPTRKASSSHNKIKILSTAIAVNGELSSKSSSNNASYVLPVDNIRLNVNEKARTVTSICTSGTLCTISAEDGIEGSPFGSFVDYVLDDVGNPILLMNEMSMHTINIRKQSDKNDQAMVTLFTQLGGNTVMSASMGRIGSSPSSSSKGLQDVSRCSLTGTLVKMEKNDPQMDSVRMKYSLTHTYADQVMDSPKFAFYRLTPKKIYFVGGFGVLAKWVDPIDYQQAAPDILAKEASNIIERVNRDHIDDLRYTAQYLLGISNDVEVIRMTSIDRLGMDIRVTWKQGTRRNKLQTDEFRIGFRIPIKSTEDAKSEVLKVFQEAWEIGNGFTWGDDDDNADANATIIPIMKIAADSLE